MKPRCKLLRERKAYPCYCSAEELDAKRKQAEREHRRPVYDRKCRGLDFPADLPLPDKSAGRNYTIRFAMPLDGETVVDDLVKGRMVFQNSELDDFIIVRSDGSPIYNFASILDDVDMQHHAYRSRRRPRARTLRARCRWRTRSGSRRRPSRICRRCWGPTARRCRSVTARPR